MQRVNHYQFAVYIDVHGCQMNTNDAEIVWSILNSHGYSRTSVQSEADVWLIVTCSIREGAERKIWAKLQGIKDRKQITELR